MGLLFQNVQNFGCLLSKISNYGDIINQQFSNYCIKKINLPDNILYTNIKYLPLLRKRGTYEKRTFEGKSNIKAIFSFRTLKTKLISFFQWSMVVKIIMIIMIPKFKAILRDLLISVPSIYILLNKFSAVYINQ